MEAGLRLFPDLVHSLAGFARFLLMLEEFDELRISSEPLVQRCGMPLFILSHGTNPWLGLGRPRRATVPVGRLIISGALHRQDLAPATFNDSSHVLDPLSDRGADFGLITILVVGCDDSGLNMIDCKLANMRRYI